jgi:salicylate hydroxylase
VTTPTLQDAPVVVAGAGIGGLTAALALARAGRRVAILEKAPVIEEVGAGLQIAPNAGRILQNLGLTEAADAASLQPQAIVIRSAKNGAELSRLPLEGAKERWGAPFRLFHRADLQKLLLAAAEANPAISIRTSARVGDFDEEDGVVCLRVHGDKGPEDMEAAGLVGADGVRSSVRAFLLGRKKNAPAYSGHTAWRAVLPAAAVPAALRAFETNLWLARRAHVVHYPLRDGEIVNALVVVEDAVSPPPAEPTTLDGAALLREAGLAECASPLRELIEAEGAWRRWPLYGHAALSAWSRGAVTLLGDAAHPMVPFLAQGAAQAIEDAAALGAACAGSAPLADAFCAYERARLSRTTRVQSASRRQGFYFHAGFPIAPARDLVMRLIGGQGMLSRNAWIYR